LTRRPASPFAASMPSAALLLLQGADALMPRPPAPSAFEAYGFAGVIFASFFFLVCFVILMGGRYFTKRDDAWAAMQERKDAALKEALDRRDAALTAGLEKLGAAHEKAVDRVALAAEKSSDASASVNREMAGALRDLQKEVQQSHKALSDETIAAIFRRALRDVKSE
jgi:hypothetical protein